MIPILVMIALSRWSSVRAGVRPPAQGQHSISRAAPVERADALPDAHDLADHHRDGRLKSGRSGPINDIRERAGDRLLPHGATGSNQRHRRVRRPMVIEKLTDDPGKSAQAHQDHDRVNRCRQLRPIDRRSALARVFVAGHDGE
jgi:hypothetical protein